MATLQSTSRFLAAALTAAILASGPGVAKADAARRIGVAGIYTQSVQQKWDARLHQALRNAEGRGEIEYVFSDRVAPADYVRVLREYAGSGGVDLIVGEAFGIGREARKVADDHPEVAFLMGDSLGPHGANFAVLNRGR